MTSPPLTADRPEWREYIARVLHDAATGKIAPDPEDPTPYGRMADAVLDDIAAPFQEECRRLYEALDRLRPGHNTPYVDEEHQGGNCVDVLMAALLRAHNAEAESRQLRDRPDGNHLMTEACRVYRIVVEVPAHVADLDGLATAVADAAHDWEPEQRDGWDVDVSAGVVPDSRVKKS